MRRLGLALAVVGATLLAPGLPLLPAAGPAAADPANFMSLALLADLDLVEVALDATRFGAERVAVIRITNKGPLPVRGWVGACSTVFTTGDPADSPLRPAESGLFVAGPRNTVQLIRPFRLVDPSKRPPGRARYALDDEAWPEPGCRDDR
jgi:hypothetical protein